ncbi:glutamine amidotransferase [Brachybacterium sp. JHP9]|uniref:Glutamine amidotransferase n=1 Tax=Brachybacterium equifaecis TaxID=2910770 RepID=A0ABT0R386_9MICO|nr:glutamine amidotransferase [Brachybacterium equifaecis]MCL6424220.1 glutamine amidotransferase [Brachybacterium equifaecis]
MRPFLLIATRPEDDAARGEYEAVLRFTGLEPEQLRHVRIHDAPLPPIDLEEISGIILGGSPFNTSDPDEEKSPEQRRAESDLAALLDEVVEADFPFFGACYGVGTLGVHQGGLIDRTYGEAVGGVTVTLTEEGLADPLVREAGVPAQFTGFVGHKEAVTQLPAHAVLLGSGENAPVQMFRVRENLYATQFHPELDAAGLEHRIRVYRDNGYFDPAEMEDLIARVREVDTHHAAALLGAFARRYAR